LIQTAFLGDVVLATALQRRVADSLPDAEIHWLVRPDAEAIVAPLVLPGHVLVYAKRGEEKGLAGFFRMSAVLAERQFDAALAVQRSFRTAALLWHAGIPTRVGFSGAGGSFFYTDRVAYRGEHARDRMLRLVEGIGLAAADPPLPYLAVDPAAKQAVGERLAGEGVAAEARLVVLAPGSAWATKQWPARYFGAVASELLSCGYDRAIVIGGPGDRSLAGEVASAAGDLSGSVLDWTGLTTTAEMVAVIDRAALCLANDSGPGHVSGAVDTPLVSIFGPTTPEMGFAPLGSSVVLVGREDLGCRPCSRHGSARCPISTHACMEDLAPEFVLRAVESLNV
jgi:heptosyltransferase-2